MFKAPEQYRDRRHPQLKTDESYGNNGYFVVPHERIDDFEYRILCSDGSGWEHVSVSIARKRHGAKRCPTWAEMCYVKDLFWSKEDCVIQYHPAESEYVNMHPFVLHLWRPTDRDIPIPKKEMIGVNLTKEQMNELEERMKA